MKAGNYEQCVREFANALQCLQEVIQTPAAEVDHPALPMVHDALESHFADLLRSDGGCDQIRGGAYVFARPLFIPRIAAQCPTTNALMIKVILLNLGISHHIMAAQGGRVPRDVFLKKACRLYRLCYQVQTHHTLAERHLLPALVNNLGLVHLKMQEKSRAIHFFRLLTRMVMHANAIGSSSYRNNNNIDCFLSNAWNASPKPFLPAAAA